MTQVAKIEPQGPVSQVPAPASEASAILSMIERAARDPSDDTKRSRKSPQRDHKPATAQRRRYKIGKLKRPR